MQRRAKIICTIGPATDSEERILELAEAGMNVARLNFSHGNHEDHRAVYERVRRVSEKLGRSIAVLQDLQGPKIRVGTFTEGVVRLDPGRPFSLYMTEREGDVDGVSVSYAGLHEEVKTGDDIMLNDGLIRLTVTAVHEDRLETEVVIGGRLSDRKGINLPRSGLSLSSLTDKDREDLAFGLSLGVDYVALSFVRSALDVHQLRFLLPQSNDAPHIIAKIEKPQAVDNLHDIIAASDGIMIARGDLGVELPPERVPSIQKEAIALANQMGKVSITATQMLESMTASPQPTRAEASDVANAVFDGTAAVMLSGETATGQYPIEAVQMMHRIVEEAERRSLTIETRAMTSHDRGRLLAFPTAIARAAVVAAEELKVKAVTCFTISGRTPRLIMSQRPSREVMAFTPSERTFHRMALYWGVKPVRSEVRYDTDELIEHVESVLRREHFARDGDQIIIVMGVPVGRGTPTNTIKFHSLGDDRLLREGDED